MRNTIKRHGWLARIGQSIALVQVEPKRVGRLQQQLQDHLRPIRSEVHGSART